MQKRRLKNLKGRKDSAYITEHYLVSYDIASLSRYKRIDELKLADGKVIKATLSPADMAILPVDGIIPYAVTESEKNRIDIITTKLYGRAHMYWALCYMNGISDPLILKDNQLITGPVKTGLFKFPNPLA